VFLDIAMKLTNAHKCVMYHIKKYSFYMSRPLLWPFSGRCIAKAGYTQIVQKSVKKFTDVKF